MLRITVELVPFGDESRKKIINSMVVANNMEGGYEAYTSADAWTDEPPKYGLLMEHDRTESVWNLIAKLIPTLGATPATELAKRLKLKISQDGVDET